MAHRSSSSSMTDKWPYDVFLSFYGDDTRLGFVSHLYESLRRRGIRAFIDYKIRDGEHITTALLRAIEKSRIAIIVFSENYANSTFCLQELEKIVDCFEEDNRLIYPVFYHVDPSELRRPKGSYAVALARLEEIFKDERHKVEKWRQALSQTADLKGCHLKSKIANEEECITRITSEVAVRINLNPLHVANYPVGLESRVKKVISCLDVWSTEEIKMIGIWGAGGIGKSTIARAVFNAIACDFEGSYFLSDVRKQSKMPNGLLDLQQKLLDRLVMEKDYKLGDHHEGIPIIKHRLKEKKLLLILDDVDESNQLKALAGGCDWFGQGSRIIITTRNKQLLKSHGIKSIYDVKELNGEESLKLFTWYAFKKEHVDSNYMEVCKRVLHYCCGFPLVLEVIGSYLYGKEVRQWSSALDQFKSIPDRIVLNALKLSFDMLEEVEKQVFLDLACFFNGEKSTCVNDMLLCIRGIQPEYAIRNLVDKSLIKIENNCIAMHDLIEDLGKDIVRQESSYEPGERSRLWFYQDILHVLQQDTGTNKVEAIILNLPGSIEVQWSGEELMKMKNLKMLVIRNACFSECPKYLPNSLKWLQWKGYPFKFLPFDKKFPNLSRMNLSFCEFLQQIPDLSGAFNLTELRICYCTNLTEIHDSVGCLNKLSLLSARRCKNLKILPSRFKLPSLEHLNLFGCSSLQTFPEIPIVMKEMRKLRLSKIAITELPSSVCNLIGLKKLSVRNCPNLKQLPSSICTLPNLWKLTIKSCQGLSHFKMREGGDEASLYCSAKSSKMEQLCFPNCNLSYDSLVFCLSHFTNMIHLDLRYNKFTILPECIEENQNLKYLLLNNCIQLEHIGGMPPNLDKFIAKCCTSLTESSKKKVFKKALNTEPGKRKFILPGKQLPKGLHHYNQGSSVSFWVRNVFPMASLWVLFKDHRHHVYNYVFSVRINGTKVDITDSMWPVLTRIATDHIYICDMQSIIRSTELLRVNKWNQVEMSFESEAKEIYFGVHIYNLQSNLENIQFMDPRRFIIGTNLFQKIQGQEDWQDVEEDMNLDSNSTKYVEPLDNPMHYQGRQDSSPSQSGALRNADVCTPETSYDFENPKESESPRFQAILRDTSAPRNRLPGGLKIFSHELDLKGVRPYPFWKCRRLNNLEVLAAVRAKFDKEKEEVNSELAILVAYLLEVLEKNVDSHPEWQETLEDLLVLARSCAMTSPGEFWLQCEGIVQELDDRRQELPPGTLKHLTVRMLFILTRCTRLLQFHKESGLAEDEHVFNLQQSRVLHSSEKRIPPGLGRGAKVSSAAKGSNSPAKKFYSQEQRILDWTKDVKPESLSLPVDDDSSKHLESPSGRDWMATWKKFPSPSAESAKEAAQLKDQTYERVESSKLLNKRSNSDVDLSTAKPSEHVPVNDSQEHTLKNQQKVSWGYWGDQQNISEESSIICRICEEQVPTSNVEDHSRICAIADRCDQKGLSVNERLMRVADTLEKMVDLCTQKDIQQAGGSPDVAKVSNSSMTEESDAISPKLSDSSRRGSVDMLDCFPEADNSAFMDDLKALPLISCKNRLGPKSDQGMTTSSAGSMTPRSPLLTPKMSHIDLLLAGRGSYSDQDDIPLMNELADIARCVANTSLDDDRSISYLLACLDDLRVVVERRKIDALTVETFGTCIEKLIREKYLQLTEMVEDEKIDLASTVIEEDAPLEDDMVRSLRTSPIHSSKDRTTIDDFEIIKPISRGAFGRVFLAKKRTTGDLFAIKVLKKADMIRKNAVESILAERDILITVRNPFVVRFFYSFTCSENLYLVMEYLNGGDLYSLLRNLGCLDEEVARVYIAEVVLALEYLHSLRIVHRDLKPDNLLIAHDGHIKLTDFGLSRVGLINSTDDLSGPAVSGTSLLGKDEPQLSTSEHQRERREKRSAVGTPDYLAPEILLGTGHGYTADWWSVGVILFELLVGIPPFNAEHPQNIFDNILNRKIPWPHVPEEMSPEARDLIDRLLTDDPSQRFGAGETSEVKQHIFFKDINWDTLARQKAALVPASESALDTSYFTSRYSWNTSDGLVYQESDVEDSSDADSLSDVEDSSDADSLSGSSGCVSNRQDELGGEWGGLTELESGSSVNYSFRNFSFKNLSQLASINYDLLTKGYKDEPPTSSSS